MTNGEHEPTQRLFGALHELERWAANNAIELGPTLYPTMGKLVGHIDELRAYFADTQKEGR